MASPRPESGLSRARLLLNSVLVAIAVFVPGCTVGLRAEGRSGGIELTPGTVPAPRDLAPYAGLGTWVDVFDYAPNYAGSQPPVTPEDVDEMADHGVRTLFLQAARWDDRSPGGLVDRKLLRQFLVNAHDRGLRVVGWYLPSFDDVDRDLERLGQVRDFEASGHRFDGVAVDIEYTEAVPDVTERNARLVELSRRFRAASPGLPIAAVVLPAVQLEVVNPRYWPDFPYRDLAGSYDLWMPMAYWSFRSGPYGDGYAYVHESVTRLRANLGRPDAVVAPIGGIADEIADAHIAQFAQALVDSNSIGGSLYDWNTLPPGRRHLLHLAFAEGPASRLPAPPPWSPDR